MENLSYSYNEYDYPISKSIEMITARRKEALAFVQDALAKQISLAAFAAIHGDEEGRNRGRRRKKESAACSPARTTTFNGNDNAHSAALAA